jgi:hypothetical protein
MRRTLNGLLSLTLAFGAVPVGLPAEPVPMAAGPVAASLGPAYRDAHLGLQAGNVVVMSSGDISPEITDPKSDDFATSEIIVRAQPDLVLTLGDNQYFDGNRALFHSALGFDGSWGRVKGLIRPAEGNHDAADPGAGSPGFQDYFADNLANLECTRLNPPCRPDQGYYDFDLPNGWYVLVLNSNCRRSDGSTGDVETPACGRGSPQLAWLNFAQQRRHGGQHSGRKCSIAVWHHERWGTWFFADDPVTQELWLSLNRFHADLVLSGHTHSTARLGAMTPQGHLAPGGNGIRQISAGAGGKSLSPLRLNRPREGTRYRNGTRYGVNRLVLTSATSPAGWQTGSWISEFDYTDGTVGDNRNSTAGCWP